VDLLLEHIFKNQSHGFYIDVGCQHPVMNNNTYLLYKKGWNGINIDLDKKNIDLFNFYRKRDLNLNFAISSQEGERDLFFYHDKSAINTVEKSVANYQRAQVKEIKKVKTKTLNSIIENSKFNNLTIDFVSIDVEGHELDVIKGFDLKKYKPKVVIIEFLDLSLKKLEIKNLNIKNFLKSEIYRYMVDKNYTLVNLIHSDLVFVNNSFRD
tara:strand:- start:458 stop:1087 length:630 start_codon:yes stop_codon:yes gene_type:complete